MAKQAPTVERVAARTFLVLAWDGPGSDVPRDRELEGHLDYIETNLPRYLCCGPIRADDRSRLAGSFFLLTAADAAEARRFLQGDPYFASGMYADIAVHEVTVAAGSQLGGVIWESAEAIRAAAESAGDG